MTSGVVTSARSVHVVSLKQYTSFDVRSIYTFSDLHKLTQVLQTWHDLFAQVTLASHFLLTFDLFAQIYIHTSILLIEMSLDGSTVSN